MVDVSAIIILVAYTWGKDDYDRSWTSLLYSYVLHTYVDRNDVSAIIMFFTYCGG